MAARKKVPVNKYREDINRALKKDQMRNVTFRLPVEIIDDFKRECEENGFKMNQVIQQLMKKYIE